MHRRFGFTITEMLVSMALMMFIMVILSEAFIAGLNSFSQLKAIGDMETKLRSVATILRRDLEAPHFCNESPGPMRLSNFNPTGAGNANMGGFFAVLASYSWTPKPAAAPTLASGPGVPSNNGQTGCTTLFMAQGSITATNAPIAGMPIRLTDGGSNTEIIEVSPSYTPPSIVNGYPTIPLASPIRKTLPYKYVQWPSAPTPDGGTGTTDADGVPSYGNQVPGFALHFTVNRSGTPYDTGVAKQQRRESYFVANLQSAVGGVLTMPNSNSLMFPGAGQWLLQSTISPSLMQPQQLPYSLLPPASPPTTTPLANAVTGQPPFYDSKNYYTPYAEVAYFLRPASQQTAAPVGGSASPLFTLYRRQVALLSTPNDYQNMNTAVAGSPFGATSATLPAVIGKLQPVVVNATTTKAPNNTPYYDFSWIPVADTNGSYFMHFNSMQDVTHPSRRCLTYGLFNTSSSGNGVNPSNWWPPQNISSSSGLATDPGIPIIGDRGEPNVGADVLMTNVVAMTVRVRRAYGNQFDTGELAFEGFDTAYNPPFRVIALEIMLRVYDQKTQNTRQLTIIQNM